MSQTHRRSTRNGGIASRTQPNILKSRKRKASENEVDCKQQKDGSQRNAQEMATGTSSMPARPLIDVTATSLNVEHSRAITPEVIQEDWQRFRCLTCFPTPQRKRQVPLPKLDWADRTQVWDLMCMKDNLYKKNPCYLLNHPALQVRMRAILLTWMTEVCEVYKLHRETYHLAIDYIDRYLSLSKNVPKQQLQLLGITCLFIASKIEEIYPPKLCEFSYVTDGACTDSEILEKELVILKTLNWDLTPVTSNSWLNTFLQLLQELAESNCSEFLDRQESSDHEFIFPRYSGLSFVQAARLLDLCHLDINSLLFSSSKLAASAVRFLTNTSLACQVSGYSVCDLQDCLKWMTPFAITVQEYGPATLKMFNQIPADDVHNIQTHTMDLDALDRVALNRIELNNMRCSPPFLQVPPEVLTPPRTNPKKHQQEPHS